MAEQPGSTALKRKLFGVMKVQNLQKFPFLLFSNVLAEAWICMINGSEYDK